MDPAETAETFLAKASQFASDEKFRDAYDAYLDAIETVVLNLRRNKVADTAQFRWFDVARKALNGAEAQLAALVAFADDGGNDDAKSSLPDDDETCSTDGDDACKNVLAMAQKLVVENKPNFDRKWLVAPPSPLLEKLQTAMQQLALAEYQQQNLSVEQKSLVANIDQTFLREMRLALENIQLMKAAIGQLQVRITQFTEETHLHLISVAAGILEDDISELPKVRFVKRKRSLLNWTASEFAHQLTLVGVKLFQAVLATAADDTSFWDTFFTSLSSSKGIQVKRLVDWEKIIQRILIVELLTAPDTEHMVQCIRFTLETLRRLHDNYRNMSASCALMSACQTKWFAEAILKKVWPLLEPEERTEWEWWDNVVIEKSSSAKNTQDLIFNGFPEYEQMFESMIEHFQTCCDVKARSLPMTQRKDMLVGLPWIHAVSRTIQRSADLKLSSETIAQLRMHLQGCLTYTPDESKTTLSNIEVPPLTDLNFINGGNEDLEHWIVTNFTTAEERLNEFKPDSSQDADCSVTADNLDTEFDDMAIGAIGADVYDNIFGS